MNNNYSKPVNLGNSAEYSIESLAKIIRDLIGNNNQIEIKEKLEDDPRRRKPDISTAKREFNWEPKVSLMDGLKLTVDYFRNELKRNENAYLSKDPTMHSIYYMSPKEEEELNKKNNKHIEL